MSDLEWCDDILSRSSGNTVELSCFMSERDGEPVLCFSAINISYLLYWIFNGVEKISINSGRCSKCPLQCGREELTRRLYLLHKFCLKAEICFLPAKYGSDWIEVKVENRRKAPFRSKSLSKQARYMYSEMLDDYNDRSRFRVSGDRLNSKIKSMLQAIT